MRHMTALKPGALAVTYFKVQHTSFLVFIHTIRMYFVIRN